MIRLKRIVPVLLCVLMAAMVWGCSEGEGGSAAGAAADGANSPSSGPGADLTAAPTPTATDASPKLAANKPQTKPTPDEIKAEAKARALRANATLDRAKPATTQPSNPADYLVQVQPTALDLGTAATGESAKGIVQLINNGDRPMTVTDCKTSCGCTTALCPRGQELQPGETADVEISISTGSISRTISKTVTFIVQDQPPLTLPVTVKVVAYVTLEPSAIGPDLIPGGEVVLRATDDRPFRVLSMTPAIIEEFDDESKVEHELVLSWDRWKELGQGRKLVFNIDHPKAKQVQGFVRGGTPLTAKQDATTRPAIAQPPAVDTALTLAVKRGDVQAITDALEKGMKQPARDLLLGSASRYGRAEIMKILIEGGADIEAQDARGRTPLMSAVQSRNAQAVQTLIANGAEVNGRDKDRGISVLAWAAGRFGDSAMIDALLAAGADANSTDSRGMTPLMWAAGFGDATRVASLLEAGANVQASDNTRGTTALMYAAKTGSVESLKLLLPAVGKADLDATGTYGKTALAWAAQTGTAEKVQALIDAGADVNSRDERGWTPLEQARSRRDPKAADVIKILEPLTQVNEDATETPGG